MLKKYWLPLIIICGIGIYAFLYFVFSPWNAKKLYEFGQKEFVEKDMDNMIAAVKEKCDISEISAELVMDEDYYDSDYKKKDRTLYVGGDIVFTCSDIDQFLSAEKNSDDANKLQSYMHSMRYAFKDYHFTEYSGLYGKVHLILNYDEMKVISPSGHTFTYTYTYNNETQTIYIDEKEVYHYTKKSKQDDTGYSGSYDATLSYDNGDSLICKSDDILERYMSALVQNNQGTIDELVNSGDVTTVPKGTKCNIVQSGLTKCQVKILEGSHTGETVWVLVESVHKK